MVFLDKELIRVASNKEESHFRLIINSDLTELQKVESFTEELSNRMNFTDEEKDSLAISITEIVSNGIVHGNKLDKTKKVVIDYELSPNTITISVQDEGAGFDIDKIENPLKPQNLLKESGRGIFIVKALMDDLSFHFDRTGTTVKMVKNKADN